MPSSTSFPRSSVIAKVCQNPVRFAPHKSIVSYAIPAICWLDERASIRVAGADARSFLHAQLTQNIMQLGTDRSALAAWLDPRGRIRAIFDVLPADGGFVLVTSADLVEQLVSQLRKYILRARVEVDPLPDYRIATLVGDSVPWLDNHGVPLGAAARSLTQAGPIVWWRLGPEHVRAAGPAAALSAAVDGLPDASTAAADLAEIALGLPSVSAATALRHVPQMLNLDKLEAIAFDKGCYPGQEIVARTQNLGSVKRRLFRFSAPAGPLPPAGAAIVDRDGAAIGEVLRSAVSDAGVQLLAVVPLSSIEGPLALAADGRVLARLPLPFD
jgi:hypothetical protein